MADRSEVSEERLLQVLTTEHSTLQSARMGSISEGNSRVQIFLTTLSASRRRRSSASFASQARPYVVRVSSIIAML